MPPASLIERRKLIPVILVDGPCAGRWEHVAVFGDECWARVGKPLKTGVETQMWARYTHNPVGRGEYLWSGDVTDSQSLADALRWHQQDGNTHGEAYGA